MTDKIVLFDTTYLQYATDMRGVPQVIIQLLRFFVNENVYGQNVAFAATDEIRRKYLLPLGVPESKIRIVKPLPGFLKSSLFHGFFSGIRYRNILRNVGLIIHPEYRSFFFTSIPQIVLIYDLIYLHPHFIIGKSKFVRFCIYYYKTIKLSRAFQLIAISNFTKKQILHFLPLYPPERITVLHLGSRATLSSNSVCSRNPVDALKFLYVGGFDNRKNVHMLLNNFKTIRKTCEDQLVLIGAMANCEKAKLNEAITKNQLQQSVKIAGVIDDTTLQKYYDQSHFFLFPSLMEGFGLPVIEAMRSGLIVCAFDNSTMNEIGGDSIILKDNNDFVGWGSEIKRLLSNRNDYALLSKKAIEKSAYFSEEQMLQRFRTYFTAISAKLINDQVALL